MKVEGEGEQWKVNFRYKVKVEGEGEQWKVNFRYKVERYPVAVTNGTE